MRIRISLLALFITFNSALVHANTIWTDVKSNNQQRNSTSLFLMPDSYRLLQLNEDAIKNDLSNASKTATTGKTSSQPTQQIELPLPDGSMLSLNISQSNTMAPELAAKYPSIKTYRVDSGLNNGIYGAIDMTEQGFHAMLFTKDGKRLFIDPRSSANEKFYISYFDTDYHPTEKQPHICNNPEHQQGKLKKFLKSSTQQRSGTTLRTYRLAMSATGEYTAFHGGTVAQALSAITTTINRVNVIYERDLAVKLQLVGNTNSLIFTNASTDPFTPSDPDSLLDDNQTLTDNTIGSGNYDIGHVVGTGGGGLAGLGVVCNNSRKAQGETGSSQPVGDSFDIDFVAHEIGHQFGGTHTFNSTTGSCAGGNRTAATAYEPGGGTTIMAYAGICGNNNVQNNSDAMFHIQSIEQMGNYIDQDTGNTCGTNSSLNNQQPTANAGTNYNIPANTPFVLTGTATDANADSLTYSWEQIDAGDATDATVSTTNNAIFRSFLPTTNTHRFFPAITDIIANSTTLGETLPTAARTMNFSFAVRDNKGGVARDTMIVNVSNSTGFKVTSHNASQTLTTPNTVVTWDTANTTSAPVNCSQVLIALSTDGGNTFTDVSGGGTANDGTENILIPANITTSSNARFKVQCANNVFFDISDADLTLNIQPTFQALSPILSNTGNNNAADPGETIQLNIPLSNQTTSAITTLSGVLSSSIQGTIVSVANSTYPNLQPGNQANNSSPYLLKIPTGFTCGADFPISLNTSFFTQGANTNKPFALTIPTGTSQNTKLSNTTAQAIPDNNNSGITSTISISGVGVIANPTITIDIDISHTYRGDISMSLTSPQGTIVQLKATDGDDSNDNIIGNFPTTFTPVNSLSAFNGENLNGTWTLKAIDNFNLDTGTLNNWSINYSTISCDTTFEDGDLDSDGMPDSWEIQFGLNPLNAQDASIDSDGDGINNLQEYLNGTNPNVADVSGTPPAAALIPILNLLLFED
ncbi:MAG: zinc-dependent metalloprotease family protein [Thiotrichaceae bacterium]